jgi:hypothetical protein
MSSRQEEKAQRKAEREAIEQKAAASASRTKRLQIVGGVVVGLVVVAVAVVLVVGSGGGSSDSGGPSTSASTSVALPTRKIENLDEAVKAGGCTYKAYPIEGSTHVTTKVKYKTNPPTSGNHNPVPAEDGIYDAGNAPEKEHFVHSLEHGRIEFQYKPGASQKTIDTLNALYNEPVNGTPGYHALLFENNTGMTAPVAATAWGRMLTCDNLSSASIDALRAFRDKYTDKGPEFIP